MSDIRAKFYERLKSRNENQLKAIEAINGPVMVVAGPGTGKTDVLGLRIGYILEHTDTPIQNILCLTYTEAGAVEMRNRLMEYIGPTAFNAQVFTFHGFCNMVIHEHVELFGAFRDSQPVSDLEQFQILAQIIDELPMGHALKRYTGEIYYETRRLRNLYATMKLEQWTPQFMHEKIDEWIEECRESDDFRYKNKYTHPITKVSYAAGDLKEAQFKTKVLDKMALLRVAVDTFDRYNELLREIGRYDYHDMLTWVHDRFTENHDLLAEYQERYQYFLVDEFQDSNGIQMALLNLLLSQWEGSSDVFIVGDDDQSIFRFQGAMMKNILDFKKLYDPEVVVLTDNYRSTQDILDASGALIKNNNERLVVEYPEYTKNLLARADHAAAGPLPEIAVFEQMDQEQVWLLKELTDLHREGSLQEESVAVIYRKHAQVEDIVHALEVREIPINVKRPVNILERPLIRNIISILKYISDEIDEYGAGEPLLYEIMHLRFFGISARDAGIFAVEQRKRGSESRRNKWRDVMGDGLYLQRIGVSNVDSIVALDHLLEGWIRDYRHLTIQELLEQVLTKGGIMDDIFHSPNRSWHLQLIKTFFDHVKDVAKRGDHIALKPFLEDLALMEQHGIEMPVHKVLTAPDGIHFVTAHSAKGMQFDRVYLIGCTKQIWNSNRGNMGSFTLPGNLSPVSTSGTEEDERRLFYVAMTRARRSLMMSYSELNQDGRELEQSRFIREILDAGEIDTTLRMIEEADFAAFAVDLLTPRELRTPLIDDSIIQPVLDEFVMSLSSLNKYLECPRKFYFENILRVPQARKTYFGFGRAMHNALEQFFTWKLIDGQVQGTADDLVMFFEKSMKKNRGYFTSHEFDLHMHLGEKCLRGYFDHAKESWTGAEKFDVELKIDHAQHRGVPMKGTLDRADHYNNSIVITDYKTGKVSNASKKLKGPTDKDPNGGDYWRQIVFYKILIDADPKLNKTMTTGFMDFIQPKDDGTFVQEKIVVSGEDVDFVSNQIVETYNRIMNKEFGKGCNEPTCYWCNLVKNEMRVDRAVELPAEMDE